MPTEPGKTCRRTPGAIFFPFNIFCAIRKSSILPFVHVPNNARLNGIPSTSETGTENCDPPGFATMGESEDPSISIFLAYFASESLSTNSHALSVLPDKKSAVLSSAAIIPFFAPASTAILHNESRESILRALIALPVYSIAI